MISCTMLPDVLELNSFRICGGSRGFSSNLDFCCIYQYQTLQAYDLHTIYKDIIYKISVQVLSSYKDIILVSGNNSTSGTDYQPDRPIGYGAFGVVWSVTDPRDGKRVALKKLPNVFQSLVSSKRVFRELKMMIFFKHENVLSCLDILQVKRF